MKDGITDSVAVAVLERVFEREMVCSECQAKDTTAPTRVEDLSSRPLLTFNCYASDLNACVSILMLNPIQVDHN